MTALLVDMDGTLLDTREANWRAYRDALAEAGVIIPREEFDARSEGRHWRDFLPAMLVGNAADPAAVAARKAALYPSLFGHVAVNHALVALIEALPGRAALVTTASRVSVAALLDRLDLARLFATVVTGDDVIRHKPAPDAYALAAARLGVTAAECLVIEDSDIGVAAGQAFGAWVFRVRM